MTSSLLHAADVLGLVVAAYLKIKPTQGAPTCPTFNYGRWGQLDVCGSPVWHGCHSSPPEGSGLKNGEVHVLLATTSGP